RFGRPRAADRVGVESIGLSVECDRSRGRDRGESMTKLRFVSLAFAGAALAADPATLERGQKEEARTCVPCHSLRIVHSQRLSKAAWGRELDKMAGWGTQIQDRDALLEYLVANFGDDKPAPKPETTGSAGAKK